MEEKVNGYKELVQVAYDSVKGLSAPDEYKLTGYQIVLKSLLVTPNSAPADSAAHSPAQTGKAAESNGEAADWQTQIASRIDIDVDKVGEIYHRTDEGAIELIIEAKDLPSANSKATIDIAALLSAGRQAAGIEKVTSFEEVRKASEHYRVYDRKNFARSVRQLGSKFRIDMSATPATIELTNGAYKIAGEIAQKYAGDK